MPRPRVKRINESAMGYCVAVIGKAAAPAQSARSRM
jgi:hypothetical protein